MKTALSLRERARCRRFHQRSPARSCAGRSGPGERLVGGRHSPLPAKHSIRENNTKNRRYKRSPASFKDSGWEKPQTSKSTKSALLSHWSFTFLHALAL
jgi:hypothetical protein